jgi:hypothetical protein
MDMESSEVTAGQYNCQLGGVLRRDDQSTRVSAILDKLGQKLTDRQADNTGAAQDLILIFM